MNPITQISDMFAEVGEYLNKMWENVRVGSDYKCPDCGKTEFHHSECQLLDMRDKCFNMLES